MSPSYFTVFGSYCTVISVVLPGTICWMKRAGSTLIDRTVGLNAYLQYMLYRLHPKLTRARCIRFLLLKFNRVLFFNSTIFKLTKESINTYLLKKYMPEKNVRKRKSEKCMFTMSNWDRKSKLAGTELLNPRGSEHATF